MCCMMKPFSALVLIPSTMFLVISFFVMLAIRKLETGRLKTFGKVLVVLLFICAAMFILKGTCFVSEGHYFQGKMMHGRMNCPMMQGMSSDQMMAH